MKKSDESEMKTKQKIHCKYMEDNQNNQLGCLLKWLHRVRWAFLTICLNVCTDILICSSTHKE